MEGQISISDYMGSMTHDQNGRLRLAPEWMKRERCETCRYWEMFATEHQPPAGWGVKGQCNCSHEPEMMRNGYWETNQTSYCQDYEGK